MCPQWRQQEGVWSNSLQAARRFPLRSPWPELQVQIYCVPHTPSVCTEVMMKCQQHCLHLTSPLYRWHRWSERLLNENDHKCKSILLLPLNVSLSSVQIKMIQYLVIYVLYITYMSSFNVSMWRHSFCLSLFRHVTGVRDHPHNPPAAAHPGGFWDMLFPDAQSKVRQFFFQHLLNVWSPGWHFIRWTQEFVIRFLLFELVHKSEWISSL